MTGPPELPEDVTRLQSGLPAVQAAVDEADAVGFVHAGRGSDPSLRFLTRVDGPDRETAVVFLAGDVDCEPEAVYCVPNDAVAEAAAFERAPWKDGIDRRVVGRSPATATGQQVRAVLADRVSDPGRLLVPRTVPHDTAVFLQEAGYGLQSTPAVRTARARKTPEERDCLRAVQVAATAGMARAEAVLAGSHPGDEGLVVDGRPLTAEQLRRQIDAELASVGVEPVSTRVEAPTLGGDQLPGGEPIQLRVAPRGPHGYHGNLTRTLVVDSEGGWERRAFIAAEAGLETATRQIDPGVAVSTVEGEAVVEVGAYGFTVALDDEPPGGAQATATVHGVGLSTHEPPARGSESELSPGSVIAVETGVDDPERGSVRLGTLFEVSEEGIETVVEYPYSLRPANRLDSSVD